MPPRTSLDTPRIAPVGARGVDEGRASGAAARREAGSGPVDAFSREARPAASARGDELPSVGRASVRARGAARTTPAGAEGGGADRVLSRAIQLAEGVTLSSRGFGVGASFSADGRGITKASAAVILSAAEALDVSPANAFSQLRGAERRQVAEHLNDFLLFDSKSRSGPSTVGVSARSGAFALTHRLLESLPRGDALAPQLVERLLSAATREQHPGLRAQMINGLDALSSRIFGAEQKRVRAGLLAELRREAPPYAEWFGDDPEPKLNVHQFVQDEFWRNELAAYRREGFQISQRSDTKVIATKVMADPANEHAPVKVEVTLEQRDENVFEPMSDPNVHVVLYTGHSGLGMVGKSSLEDAPRAAGTKLTGLIACRTKQNLPGLQRQFPGSHFLVSNVGTYGHDDRIVIQQLLEGIAARSDYAGIKAAIAKEELWEQKTYLWPSDAGQLQNVDLDGDGVMAAGANRDLVYTPVKKVRNQAASFLPARIVPDPRGLEGDGLVDAVQWFNTVHHYWAADFGSRAEKGMDDRFRSAGWFKSDDPNEVVRVQKEGAGAKAVYRVSMNAAYAKHTPEALGMLLTFALNEAVSKQTRPDEKASERRMRSLALTASFVMNQVEYWDVGDELLKNFAKRFGFPATLNYDVVSRAVGADHQHEASPKIIHLLEKGMMGAFHEVNPERTSPAFRKYVQGALNALKESETEIGRATYELIVSGRVKIDDMADMTRADFQHVKKEFAREGVDIGRFADVHDGRTRAARALTAPHSQMYGYMWDDRIYVTAGMTPKALASTLVHEVNHVLNESEENYRGAKNILREEYRAHYAEALFKGKRLGAAECAQLKAQIIEVYGLQGVTPQDVPDRPTGVLIPRLAHVG